MGTGFRNGRRPGNPGPPLVLALHADVAETGLPACGSIGIPAGARFGDRARRNARWARVFPELTPLITVHRGAADGSCRPTTRTPRRGPGRRSRSPRPGRPGRALDSAVRSFILDPSPTEEPHRRAPWARVRHRRAAHDD